MEPRDYQIAACDAAWKTVRRKRNPCICAPTGSGKSIIIAELVKQAVKQWDGRAIVLQHRKELIEQNAEKIRALLPGVNVGLYSAGLRHRDTEPDVIVAGIQSVYNRAPDFGIRHVCIVDECHRISPNEGSQYQTFLNDLGACNPYLATIGLSATPFRTGEGEITEGGILHEICYEVEINYLLERGYLCPLVNQVAKSEVDMSRVQVRGGEFVQNQMESAFLEGSNVANNASEIIACTGGRQSILVFCAGVIHAEQVQRTLEIMTGESVGLVTGDTLPIERSATLERFKSGVLRWLVNVNVLTEGFDSPRIDCVVMLRATVSAGLFAQAVGRGFRVHDSHANCLVLDFGQNIARHGALNDPDFGRKKKKHDEGQGGPTKVCEQCGASCPAGAAFCWSCEAAFPDREIKLDDKPDEEGQIISHPKWFEVEEVYMYVHRKRDNPESRTLRVDYQVGFNKQISEWVCIEHQGFARDRAWSWWQQHTLASFPPSIEDAIALFRDGALRMPKRILAKQEGRWWRILDHDFDEERPESWTESQAWDDEEIPF